MGLLGGLVALRDGAAAPITTRPRLTGASVGVMVSARGLTLKDQDKIQVQDAMSSDVLTVEPDQTMQEAASRMAERNVGSAAVVDLRRPWPGIVTERDLLHAIAEGTDPKAEPVSAHETVKVVIASPEWPLERAAETMIRGHFRHLMVVDGRRPVGMLSMRDIVRLWVQRGRHPDGSTTNSPSRAEPGRPS